MSIILHLPWPPSINDANKFGKNKRTGRMQYYPSRDKEQFFKEADALFLIQKRGLGQINGEFTYHITLNRDLRGPLDDGDNRLKYPLDCGQRYGLVDNDRKAEGGSWSWGSCEYGAMLSIHPVNPPRSQASQTESAK